MYSLSSQKTQGWLIWFLRGVLTLTFFVLMGRLVDLQLIRGQHFRDLSEGNRIRRVPIIASRGLIFARGGEELVGNTMVEKLVKFESKEGFIKTFNEEGEEGSLINESIRFYPLGHSFAHAGGYVGEINQSELGKIKGECPQKGARIIGDFTGRVGLERQYDCLLAGYNGEVLFEVDARNKTARILGKKDPTKGEDLRTNIDYPLQEKVSEVVGDKKGAIVISDPEGRILALYSSPSFDPNDFVSGKNPRAVSNALNDKNLPLFNRVIAGNFHPGSVYKPIVALAALEEKSIEPDYKYNDTGQILIENIYGSYSYKNWYFTQYGGVEGLVGIEKSLARSTDTFYYKVGELLGIENIVNWSHKFELDTLTGIDIPGEIDGLVPNPQWKLDYKGERWFLGDTYNVSIGQGDLAVTPLQINSAITAIANNGKICRPQIRFQDDPECTDLEIEKGNLDIVINGMEDVCTAGGTAFPFFDFKEKSGGIRVACKTGTAQNVNEDPHAWFVAFAPIEKPEIVVTILLENGGEGSADAAPIVREIFNYYFRVPSIVSPSPTPTNDRN